jgi:hypothetical protein
LLEKSRDVISGIRRRKSQVKILAHEKRMKIRANCGSDTNKHKNKSLNIIQTKIYVAK